MISDYNEFKKYLNNLENKPKLLLHACCGPCSTHTLNILKNHFDITVFFDNSNIDTYEEFSRRLDAQKKVIESIGDVKLIVSPYLPLTFA